MAWDKALEHSRRKRHAALLGTLAPLGFRPLRAETHQLMRLLEGCTDLQRKKTQSRAIARKDQAFGMAGLWESWNDPVTKQPLSCTSVAW